MVQGYQWEYRADTAGFFGVSKRLKPGNQAPDFILTADDGQSVRLADLRGSCIVLMFYPAVESPGCTLQACQIRDEHDEIKVLGYEIFGISADSTAEQVAFKQHHRLPYRQLSDADKAVHRAYGITRWTHPFTIMSNGRSRTTFVLDKNGTILIAWYGVQSVGHAKRLLKVLAPSQLAG